MGRKSFAIRKNSPGCAVKLKSGTVVTDVTKQDWIIKESIGAGGFGDIYVAKKVGDERSDQAYVAKIEHHNNGPLFVEMNFYLRVCKTELVRKWMGTRGPGHLGVPRCHAFGSTTYKNDRFRFLILERYGSDIGSIFEKNGRRLSLKTVLNIGIQILDILEFIHYHGYIHADIKGSNLLLGLGPGGQNSIYLLDYGLACLYVDRLGRHKEYVQDLRRAHDGTLEYTSRDAHVGAHSRRGDLEVLAYNMVQWLSGRLPWEDKLLDPEMVAAEKNRYMADISLLLEECFPHENAPAAIHQFLKYIISLDFTSKPDYDKLRSLFRQSIVDAGLEDDGKLDFSYIPTRLTSRKKGRRSDTENRIRSRSAPRARPGPRRPCGMVQDCDRRTRQRSMIGRTAALRSQKFDWVKVLQSHPELDAKAAVAKLPKQRTIRKRLINDVDESLLKPVEDPRANPTPAMVDVLRSKSRPVTPVAEPQRRRGRSAGNIACDIKRRRRSRVDSGCTSPVPCDLTPAMEAVVRKRELIRTGHYEPQCTAMSTRAERMKYQEKCQQQKKMLEDSPVAARTRRKSISYINAIAEEARRETRTVYSLRELNRAFTCEVISDDCQEDEDDDDADSLIGEVSWQEEDTASDTEVSRSRSAASCRNRRLAITRAASTIPFSEVKRRRAPRRALRSTDCFMFEAQDYKNYHDAVESDGDSERLVIEKKASVVDTPIKRGRGRPRKYPVVELNDVTVAVEAETSRALEQRLAMPPKTETSAASTSSFVERPNQTRVTRGRGRPPKKLSNPRELLEGSSASAFEQGLPMRVCIEEQEQELRRGRSRRLAIADQCPVSSEMTNQSSPVSSPETVPPPKRRRLRNDEPSTSTAAPEMPSRSTRPRRSHSGPAPSVGGDSSPPTAVIPRSPVSDAWTSPTTQRRRKRSRHAQTTLISHSSPITIEISSPGTPSSQQMRKVRNLAEKRGGRLPTQPKYRHKVLTAARFKQLARRREVSPSDVDFVPRLRSGNDGSDDFIVLNGTNAVVSRSPGRIRVFAGRQTASVRPHRPIYHVVSLF